MTSGPLSELSKRLYRILLFFRSVVQVFLANCPLLIERAAAPGMSWNARGQFHSFNLLRYGFFFKILSAGTVSLRSRPACFQGRRRPFGQRSREDGGALVWSSPLAWKNALLNVQTNHWILTRASIWNYCEASKVNAAAVFSELLF